MSTATAKTKVRKRKGARATPSAKPTPPAKRPARRAKPVAERRPIVKRPTSSAPRQPVQEPRTSQLPVATAENPAQTQAATDAAPSRPQPTQAQAIAELSRRATAGNVKCMEGLLQILDSKPGIWRAIGDVGAHVERTWIQLVAGDQALHQESVRRSLGELKQKLAGDQPSDLEKLLIDVIGATWLASRHAECEAATVDGSGPRAKFVLHQAESAQRRFLTAVKTLSTLRALAPHGLRPIPTAIDNVNRSTSQREKTTQTIADPTDADMQRIAVPCP